MRRYGRLSFISMKLLEKRPLDVQFLLKNYKTCPHPVCLRKYSIFEVFPFLGVL